jgi:branched-chain amino acid transport system ATP-binding protein
MLRPSTSAQGGVGLYARDVVASYGSLVVCRGITLFVNPGEVVALIGPNGAGKTSFVGALTGAVTGRGEIRLGDVNIAGRPIHQRTRLGLATVPDNRGLFPPLTVAENIRLGSQLVAKHERAKAVDYAVGQFPFLRERWSQLAGSLSGGQQQMLAIAKCLAGKPRALLLDEPSQGLAPIIVDELVKVIAELRASGLPILLVEQNYGLVERTADRFAVMVGGEIVLEGKKSDLADRERIGRLFLQHRKSNATTKGRAK